MDPERLDHHCTCGRALRAWQTEAGTGRRHTLWAAELADVLDYEGRRRPRHDVLDGRGRRVARGTCAGPDPARP